MTNDSPSPCAASEPAANPLRCRRLRSAIAALLAAASIAAAGETGEPPVRLDRVLLESGGEVAGRIVKRSDAAVWIDVGPQVLEIRLADVREIEASEIAASAVSDGVSLYSTASSLAERSSREHSRVLGPTVIMVSTPRGLGSGVFIHPEGFAVTNAHVVQGETSLRATAWLRQGDGSLRRTVIDAVELVALNNHYDLALIRVPHPEGGRFEAAFLEAEDRLTPGQTVFAIGNPLGLEQTLTEGVVSTRNRTIGGLSYIQTDTAVNPGNSGGPLFNSRGEVVGITNMRLLASEALNFAIPARYVKDFLRNREAFAYDLRNPNSGHLYHQPPPRRRGGTPPQLAAPAAP